MDESECSKWNPFGIRADSERLARGRAPTPTPTPTPAPHFMVTSQVQVQSVPARLGDWTWRSKPMMDNEIQRLAHAVNELRPEWPIASLVTWMRRNLANRTYRDAAVALVWVACDTKPDGTWASDKPARVLESGPWWGSAAAAGNAATRPTPPRREQACLVCGGYLGACPCQRAPRACDEDTAPTTQRPRPASPDTKTAALAAMRAGLRGKGEADA